MNKTYYRLFGSDNELIGVIDLGEYEDGLIINNITILSKYRGNNYGKIIIEKSLEQEVGRDYKGKLFADALHDGVRGFYGNLGFKDIDEYMYVKQY